MRRKRNGGAWLPPDPYNTVVAGAAALTNSTQNSVKEIFINLPNIKGGGANVSYPLIGDFKEDIIAGVLAGSATMADMTFGYSLQRIVGKIFLGVEQDNVTDIATSTWAITAGFIVRRVDENGDPVAQDLFVDSYDSARDPWIWRRQWILHNYGATPSGGWAGYAFGDTNQYSGSALDGPHVDAKTRRTVKAEERLFMDVSALALDGTDDQTTSVCRGIFDFRFFGRVFPSAGNKRNASR